MSNDEEIGTLIVVVLKARNLRDKHFYKQDVYSTVSLNGDKKRTGTDVKGGQHPVWDEEIRFPIMKNGATKHRQLVAQCWSKEHKDDDLLGEGTIDISETLKTGEFDDWIPLKTEGVERGDIYLEMTFYSNGPAPIPKPAPAPVMTPGAPKNNGLAVPINSALLQRRPSKLSPGERLSRPPSSGYPSGPQRTPPRTPPKDGSSALPPITESRISSVPNILKPGIPAGLRPANKADAPRQSYVSPLGDSGPSAPHRHNSGQTPYPQSQGVVSSYTSPQPLPLRNGAAQAPGFPSYNAPTYSAPTSMPWDAHPQPQTHAQNPPLSFSFPVPDVGNDSSTQANNQPLNSPSQYEPSRFIPSPAPSGNPIYPSGPVSFNMPGSYEPSRFTSSPVPSAPYPHSYHEPPARQTSNDLPDPYLLARYKTPLPLPPGAEDSRPSFPEPKSSESTPPTPPPKPPSPVRASQITRLPAPSRSPPLRQPTPVDENRLKRLRQAEEQAARRRQQEEDDAELARQLDREIADQEHALPPPLPRKIPSPAPMPAREDPAVVAKRLKEEEEARRKAQEDHDLELARQLDRELNLAHPE